MRKKRAVLVLLPCIEFPGFKKITLESGIKSEKGSSRTTVIIIISVMKDNDNHK